jgi:hypothetical protein
MRRPKDSKHPKSGGGDAKTPPGGRARERLDQFNRQRGLPDDSKASEEDESGDAQQPDSGDEPAKP